MASSRTVFRIIALPLLVVACTAVLHRTAPPSAAQTAPSPALRFDGLYGLSYQENGKTWYVQVRLTPAGEFFREETTADAQRLARHWWNSEGRGSGRYTVDGLNVSFESHLFSAKATIGTDLLIVKGAAMRSGEYRFVPVTFVEAKPENDEPESPSPAKPATAPEPGDPVHIALGSIRTDSGRDASDFAPLSDPRVFSAGTREIAYQVVIDSTAYGMDVSVALSAACDTGDRTANRCNKYAIVAGRPVISQWTSVVRCGNGESFKPGTGSLELSFGSEARSLTFEIR